MCKSQGRVSVGEVVHVGLCSSYSSYVTTTLSYLTSAGLTLSLQSSFHHILSTPPLDRDRWSASTCRHSTDSKKCITAAEFSTGRMFFRMGHQTLTLNFHGVLYHKIHRRCSNLLQLTLFSLWRQILIKKTPLTCIVFTDHSIMSMKGALHELIQMVNLLVNHLVKCRRVARDPNPWLKLT